MISAQALLGLSKTVRLIGTTEYAEDSFAHIGRETVGEGFPDVSRPCAFSQGLTNGGISCITVLEQLIQLKEKVLKIQKAEGGGSFACIESL